MPRARLPLKMLDTHAAFATQGMIATYLLSTDSTPPHIQMLSCKKNQQTRSQLQKNSTSNDSDNSEWNSAPVKSIQELTASALPDFISHILQRLRTGDECEIRKM